MDTLISNFFFKNQIEILNNLFSYITKLGNYGIIWIIIGIVLLLNKKTRIFGILCLITLLLEYTINDLIIKQLVMRPRPFVELNITPIIPKPSDYSFPSGHAASSFTIATLFYLSKHKLKFPILILAILIAFSRIYLLVHYTSDVICGSILGIIIANITFHLIKDKVPL